MHATRLVQSRGHPSAIHLHGRHRQSICTEDWRAARKPAAMSVPRLPLVSEFQCSVCFELLLDAVVVSSPRGTGYGVPGIPVHCFGGAASCSVTLMIMRSQSQAVCIVSRRIAACLSEGSHGAPAIGELEVYLRVGTTIAQSSVEAMTHVPSSWNLADFRGIPQTLCKLISLDILRRTDNLRAQLPSSAALASPVLLALLERPETTRQPDCSHLLHTFLNSLRNHF